MRCIAEHPRDAWSQFVGTYAKGTNSYVVDIRGRRSPLQLAGDRNVEISRELNTTERGPFFAANEFYGAGGRLGGTEVSPDDHRLGLFVGDPWTAAMCSPQRRSNKTSRVAVKCEVPIARG
jgi:hypothetical protein